MTTLLNGKYVVEQRLGGGGMAEVFAGRTVGAAGFSRRVAIKRVLPGYSDNAQFAQMFVDEARLTSRLQHANVVSVLDFDHDREGRLFLVMELVDGVDLDGLLATGMLPLPAVLFVGAEILRGLGYAHELPVDGSANLGLVHRDVSPHNVLVSWDGAVKVSDFGIAKARAASQATASQLIKGKPAYMSPEQANGEALDGGSDLFAVGVMLWEMACGQPLFAGDSTQSILARVLFAPIPSPRELRPELPPAFERVVVGLLARDRARRYPRAEDAVADLVACADYPRDGRDLIGSLLAERFAERAPRRASVAGGAQASRPSAPATPVRLPGPAAPASQVGARSRRRMVWFGLAVAAVIGGGAAVALRGWRDAARTPAAVEPAVGSSSRAGATPAPPNPAAPTEVAPVPGPPSPRGGAPRGSGGDGEEASAKGARVDSEGARIGTPGGPDEPSAKGAAGSAGSGDRPPKHTRPRLHSGSAASARGSGITEIQLGGSPDARAN